LVQEPKYRDHEVTPTAVGTATIIHEVVQMAAHPSMIPFGAAFPGPDVLAAQLSAQVDHVRNDGPPTVAAEDRWSRDVGNHRPADVLSDDSAEVVPSVPVLARPCLWNIFDPTQHGVGNRDKANEKSRIVRRQRGEIRFVAVPRRAEVVLDIRNVERGNGRAVVLQILGNRLDRFWAAKVSN
jgi:hypothetical protein